MSAWVHAARVVARRELDMVWRGVGAYVALTVTLVTVAWLLGNDLDALEQNGLLVHENPFAGPLFSAILVLSFFLAVSAVISVARDRERGTLEVLFYGPVDELSYVVGKLSGQIAAYITALPVLLLALTTLSLLTGFTLSGNVVAGLALSVIPAAEIVALGLVLSVLVTRVRTSVLLFVAVVALLVGVGAAHSFVSLIPIEDPSSPFLPLRDALGQLARVVDWVSPFAYLERTVQQLAAGSRAAAALTMIASTGYTLVAVALAVLGLRRRGVRRQGE